MTVGGINMLSKGWIHYALFLEYVKELKKPRRSRKYYKIAMMNYYIMVFKGNGIEMNKEEALK